MASSKEGTKHTHSFSEFGGVNTQAAPQSIGDNEFSWLENVAPIGHGNMIAMNGPSGVLATWSPDVSYYINTVNLNGTDYEFVFCASGAAYTVNLTTNAVVKFAVAGTFSGYGTAVCQWQNSAACIIDPTKGYFTYTGGVLSLINGTVQSITVANAGSGYTTQPSITFSPPGGGGTTATGSIDLILITATLTAAGSNYHVGDVLTVSGGTLGPLGIPAQFTVSAVTTGAITGFNITNQGDYIAVPANPIALTGGLGSGATVTAYFGLGNPVVINQGSGYTSAPQISISNSVTANTCTAAACIGSPTYGGNVYTVGDVLTVLGGAYTTAVTLTVTSVATGFAYSHQTNSTYTFNYVSGVSISNAGNYSVLPTNPVAVSGGHGTNAHFNLTFSGSGQSYSGLVANLSVAPPSGTSIASYAGRIWVGSNRTVSFTSPGSNFDFTSANAGGSFILSDETLHSAIQVMTPANGYLYIFGITSIDILSGVQVTNGITTFSEVNISSAIGSTQIMSIVPYYRSIAFSTQYGFYLLTGTTPQKISDHLDGIFPLINFAFPVSAGQVVVNDVICLAFMFNYADPVLGNRGLIAILFNKKWFFVSQGNSLTMMQTSLSTGTPTLFATDSTNLYQLMTNTTANINQTINTKLWDMGDSVRDKQALKVGIEVITPNYLTNITGTVITEFGNNFSNFYPVSNSPVDLWINNSNQTVVWQNNSLQTVSWVLSSAYNFYKDDVQTTGKYIGISMTGYAPQQKYIAMHLQYELRASWTTMPT